jgi:serine/threonine protein phosphatase PrpC
MSPASAKFASLGFSEVGAHEVNEDAFEVRHHPHDKSCWLCFLADGQGGRAGGARAAQLACYDAAEAASRLPPTELARPATWVSILKMADTSVYEDPDAGFTTLIGLCINGGLLAGASCGDSAALAVLGHGRMERITEGRFKDPLVGSTMAHVVPFGLTLVSPWSVLLMSDGVWKYAGWDCVLAAALKYHGLSVIEALRLAVWHRNGDRYPDDFTIVVIAAGEEQEHEEKDSGTGGRPFEVGLGSRFFI